MRVSEYPVVISALSAAEGGGFLVQVPDLPGCASDGETREEAARNIADAIEQWVHEAQRLGRPVPKPTEIEVA